MAPNSEHLNARNDAIVNTGVHDVATDTSTETIKLEGKLDALVNLETQLAANQKSASVARTTTTAETRHLMEMMAPNSLQFNARNDVIVVRGVHDVRKHASLARVCNIRSSNYHHTIVCPSSEQSGVDEHPEAYAAITVYDVVTDTSAETRMLEGKVDALVNLEIQLAANQKLASVAKESGVDEHPAAYALRIRSMPLLQESAASVLPMTTNQVSVLLRSNLERMSILWLVGVHDVAIDTSTKTRKLEGKLDALVNLVTQLAANQKPASVAKVYDIRSSNDHHTSVCLCSQQSGVEEHPEAYAANTYSRPPQQKLEGKQDGLVNLVTQLAANQKPASVAKVYGIRSSNDHHTSVYPSSQQYGVDEHSEAYATKTTSRPPRGVHDVPTDTSAETRKLEGKLDALVNLVTQLAANEKPASVASVYGISSPNDHHTSVCPFSQQYGVDEHLEAYTANAYSRPPQQQRQGT
ncbi:hypothetical protein Fmac_032862 [Flemingia macrophylla]|uniref:Uncharacterized protein n=1 Tax=Flemingia macrophylla TaxID=520843 RepID=A0ABD1L642_9FABA